MLLVYARRSSLLPKLTATTLAALLALPSAFVFAADPTGTTPPATTPPATTQPGTTQPGTTQPGTTPPGTTTPAPTPPPPQPVPVPAPPSEKPVRVGIGRSQSAAELKSPGGMMVVADGAVQGQVPAGQSVKLTLAAGKIQVAPLDKSFTGPVRVVPAFSPIVNRLTYNNKTYRGEFEVLVSAKDKKLSVVNVVNLEDYLLGVVPYEMPASWPLEALKAQAIAARNYALQHLGDFADEGFDLVDTTRSQVYNGVAGERPNTDLAVAATKGQVLTYNGKLASLFYFASSGGYTEGNEIIWRSSPIPYLRGVPDYDNVPGNPWFSWRRTHPIAEAAQELKESGYDVGQVQAVNPGGALGVSGRPSQWVVVGSSRTVTLNAEQMRWVFDLPSSVRQVLVKLAQSLRNFQLAESVAVVGGDRVVQQRPMQQTFVVGVGRQPKQAVNGTAAMAPGAVQGSVEFVGGGSGHAIGMSQWGAYGMASLGKNYNEILTHYFQGTKVETR